MNFELIDAMTDSKLIIFKFPFFLFIWHGGHTVNVWDAYAEIAIDAFSIGNFASDKTTIKNFITGVNRYMKNLE